MKKLLFVSTGRCGTKRISQILEQKLPEQFSVVHQMKYSRLANVIGNIGYYIQGIKAVKKPLYEFITSKYRKKKHFISSDPLTAMIIPDEYICSNDVCIVHIIRDEDSFSKSMHSITRSRSFSFIAHNFIPFWQPGLFPLENKISKDILAKYRKVARKKNSLFSEYYSKNPYYFQVDMEDIFNSDILQNIVNDFFKISISISRKELLKKSNQSNHIT